MRAAAAGGFAGSIAKVSRRVLEEQLLDEDLTYLRQGDQMARC
jgi:hypothetical protein